MPQFIKKMTDISKIAFDSRQCSDSVDIASWVSLALLMWLGIFKVFYFASFTLLDMISEECPELSRKWQISGIFFRLSRMPKVCRSRLFSFFDTAHVIQKLKIFILWKFQWVWRKVEGMPWIIKKMMDICKIVLGCGQCQKCVDVGSWVSLALLMWPAISEVFYFASFTFLDVISEECPKLSIKWKISEKLFQVLDNAKCV